MRDDSFANDNYHKATLPANRSFSIFYKTEICKKTKDIEFVKTGYPFGYDLPFVFVYPCASPTFSPLRVLPSFPFLPPFFPLSNISSPPRYEDYLGLLV